LANIIPLTYEPLTYSSPLGERNEVIGIFMPHLRSYISKREKYDKENVGRWLMAVFRSLTKKKVIFILTQKYKGEET
jgi:hypothetical protein